MADEIGTEELPEDQDTFPREYVEKLRAENARYRTELKPYKEAFKGYNDAERAYLFDIVTTLDADPSAGALKARSLAQNVLGEQFFEGLTGVPTPEQPTEEPEEGPETQEEATAAMKPEDIQKMLDERDAKAREEAEIEAVFAEVEAAGFPRGSEGFMMALSVANAQVAAGKDVNFSELAPKVHAILGTEAAPAAEEAPAEGNEAPEARETELPEAIKPREFPKTADAGGSGAPTGEQKDWLAEAAEKGISPLQAARERMEHRLESA